MKTLTVLLVLFAFTANCVLAEVVGTETTPFEQLVNEPESDLVTLKTFNVVGDSFSKHIRYVPSEAMMKWVGESIDYQLINSEKELRLPFAKGAFVSPYEDPILADRIPIKRSKWYQEDIRLGDSATIDLRVGILWKPLSTRKIGFYLPIYVRSAMSKSSAFNSGSPSINRSKSMLAVAIKIEW